MWSSTARCSSSTSAPPGPTSAASRASGCSRPRKSAAAPGGLDRARRGLQSGAIPARRALRGLPLSHRALPRRGAGRGREEGPHRAQPQRSGAGGAAPLLARRARADRAARDRRRRRRCSIAPSADALTPMPGYTHLQRAVPSSIGLWLAGFAEAFIDDAALARMTRGAGSTPARSAPPPGYGVNLPLDRAGVAQELGFARLQQNPVYMQNSRGKLELQVLGDAAATAPGSAAVRLGSLALHDGRVRVREAARRSTRRARRSCRTRRTRT